MKEFSYTIKDPLGIHARPAGALIKALSGFASNIKIVRADGNGECDGKKLLALMKLKIKQGDTIIIRADGADEDAAVKAASDFLPGNL